MFLPYLSGERTPVADAQARGILMGLGHETDANVLTHAVLDGVAFAFRDCLEALQAAGTSVERVTAVGGGSRSELWLRIIATVLNIPVDVPMDGDLGGAFGAARLGLIAATGASVTSVCTPPKIAKTISAKCQSCAPLTKMPITAMPNFILRPGRSIAHDKVLFHHGPHQV